MRIAKYLASCLSLAAVIGSNLYAAAQQTASDADANATAAITIEEMIAARKPTDVILARRILMAGIGRNMDEIRGMLERPESVDPAEAVEHADTISTMLLAFPHLFAPDTDIYSPELEAEEAALVSLTNPDVWTDYGNFYRMAQDASELALKVSRSPSLEDFLSGAKALDEACNACHATYRKDLE